MTVSFSRGVCGLTVKSATGTVFTLTVFATVVALPPLSVTRTRTVFAPAVAKLVEAVAPVKPPSPKVLLPSRSQV